MQNIAELLDFAGLKLSLESQTYFMPIVKIYLIFCLLNLTNLLVLGILLFFASLELREVATGRKE